MNTRTMMLTVMGCMLAAISARTAAGQVAVRAATVYTMTGGDHETIADGVVLVGEDGKIRAVGRAADVAIPAGWRVLSAAVATPGLIDAHGTVGVSGVFNQRQDQDQLEHSAPLQPELRAIDAYNPNDPLVAWVRSLGVTTVHTGHAPGELISGQTCIVKTAGATVEKAVVVETATVAATLGPWAQKDGKESPGTRAKMMSLLREELIRAEEYREDRERAARGEAAAEPAGRDAGGAKRPDPGARNLRREVMARVLAGEVPLLVTCNRAQDIASALRLAKEFGTVRLILDSAAEAYVLVPEIRAAGVPVIVHPTMFRMFGEMENMSMRTAGELSEAGVPVAMQSGFEGYVPKTRVVLFEAAVAAGHGMPFRRALASVTCDAAKILGIDARVGSLRPGLDGDVALYDGDPFEYTTHCTGVVIDGVVVSDAPK
jgi:imidazolonepropionase-like amidohydrolase